MRSPAAAAVFAEAAGLKNERLVREHLLPLVLEGYSQTEIARILNERGVPRIYTTNPWSQVKVSEALRRAGIRARRHVPRR